ncbi:MAG TPA: hypothetical protein PKV16_06450 [Caldisericia bacterium]|nr:hypothetical protein [Caldisericia bacterium]HPI84572.1 hypothetical protein [Caldisericia bacterium]HPQ93408.1 hypothetical protein [Caldisericia bacterium]HRV74868.1 hypothetical protein [Caldisericia bacterium]
MWIFEEKTQMTGFWWIILLVFLATIAPLVLAYVFGDLSSFAEIKPLLSIVLILDVALFGFLLGIMRYLVVRFDEKTLEFGFHPFVVKVPFDKIQSIRIKKYSFWQTGGFGIRLGANRRWNYVARTGWFVEVDWAENKRHGFSITDCEAFYGGIKDFLGDRASLEEG